MPRRHYASRDASRYGTVFGLKPDYASPKRDRRSQFAKAGMSSMRMQPSASAPALPSSKFLRAPGPIPAKYSPQKRAGGSHYTSRKNESHILHSDPLSRTQLRDAMHEFRFTPRDPATQPAVKPLQVLPEDTGTQNTPYSRYAHGRPKAKTSPSWQWHSTSSQYGSYIGVVGRGEGAARGNLRKYAPDFKMFHLAHGAMKDLQLRPDLTGAAAR